MDKTGVANGFGVLLGVGNFLNEATWLWSLSNNSLLVEKLGKVGVVQWWPCPDCLRVQERHFHRQRLPYTLRDACRHMSTADIQKVQRDITNFLCVCQEEAGQIEETSGPTWKLRGQTHVLDVAQP